MYSVFKLRFWSVLGLLKVSNILYNCGKDMAMTYDLHHWDNSHFKNWIIVILCALKNNIYLVCDKKNPVATFQTKKKGESFLFIKLATLPKYMGRGVGTFCLKKIEDLAKVEKCQEIICEVYDKSEKALSFYKSRGFFVYGTTNTLKYRELKLKKNLEE